MTIDRLTTTGPADAGSPEQGAAVTRLLYVQAPGRPRVGLADRLRRLGYGASLAADTADALRQLAETSFSACIVDLAGGRGALTTMRLIRSRHPSLPVAGVVDPAVPFVASEATHAGFADLLTWPFDDSEIAAAVADLSDRRPVSVDRGDDGSLVAFSPAMREVLRQVREAAGTPQAVCLVGPHGTGKRLVARALHQQSAHPAGALVTVDCAGTSTAALEIELFGQRPQGTTGRAVDVVSSDSALAKARKGTLFIRHLDDAPARVQLRLTALLRDRELAVGTDGQPSELDVRLVGTANGTAGPTGETSMLRPELVGRFGVTIVLPMLRRRHEDVPMLAARHLARRGETAGRAPRFSRAALELLSALPWPGNVPELEQLIDSVAASRRRPVIQIEDVLGHVSLDGTPRIPSGHPLREAREQFERECIEAALARHQGRVGEAARSLGIQRTNLYRKVRQLGISRALLSSQR